jgi:hypothetical protein
MLETVCYHILDEGGTSYARDGDVSKLYREVCQAIGLSRGGDHNPARRIIGGCNSTVTGVVEMRNAIGDAHGRGKDGIVPEERYAKLALDSATTAASFLVDTYLHGKQCPQTPVEGGASAREPTKLRLVFSAGDVRKAEAKSQTISSKSALCPTRPRNERCGGLQL